MASLIIRIVTLSTMLLSPTLTGCGSSDDSGSGGGIADASNISATTFVSVVPKTRTRSQAVTYLMDHKFIKYTGAPTTTGACITAKTKFLDKNADGYFAYPTGETNITDCFNPSEFAGTDGTTVKIKYDGRVKIKISGAEVDLKDKTANDGRTLLVGAATGVYEFEQYVRLRIVYSGVRQSDKKPYEVETLSLTENGAGQPCKGYKKDGGKSTVEACKDYTLTTTKIDGSITEQKYLLVETKRDLLSSSYTSKYYAEGSDQAVTYDNWTGTVTYTGETTAPKYSIQSGGETAEGTL